MRRLLLSTALLVAAAAVPEAAGASSLKGGVNAGGVKQFILGGGLGAPFVVLLDADNDAAFESTTVLGWAEALDSGLLEPAAWRDDLVSYASTGFF